MPDKIPKSLHTVRVLVTMTDLVLELYADMRMPLDEALDIACIRLGYGETPDTYHLKTAAMAQLDAKGS